MTMRDVLPFLRALNSDPLSVGAIAPSGPALAELITREITSSSGPVVELGPGTGVFTRALLARGIREDELTLLERGTEFVELLRVRFPLARVLQEDAASLGALELFGGPMAGAVISGLPLLNLPRDKVRAILAGAFEILRPGGAFYQFTYGARCPVPGPMLEELGLRAVRIGRAFANLPPATVYRIGRRGASAPR
ncbi:methyltransferase domain-containing protein [Labrys neptuniae]|uniref:Methyltransferase domain-containing protein n=1 Tax=Labrys neptuniae TaxID=376174 RepID=A0ABV3PQ58_9HYPH|nr:methyltransferase domain-containing protein [Labrys neptuniae]MDT3375778.1 methyltransferase domain-containing protein [Labrys neptuniae]